MSRTLAQVRTATQGRLRSSTVWAAGELDGYIKDGYSDFVAKTGALWNKAYPAGLDDVANQGTYDLPANVIEIERMTWRNRRIEPISSRKLSEILPQSYETAAGDVWAYAWSKDGFRKIRKIAVPAVSASGTTCLEGKRREAALTADGSLFEIPDWTVRFIVYYACERALRRFGPGQNVRLADHYKARYGAGIARILLRKEKVHRARTGIFGGRASTTRGGKPPRPRFPYPYPNGR